MLCIASFIVLAILGIFSARYRQLAKKAWGCVVKRITFKPCDINFGEEVKGKLLGKLILSHPRWYKILDKWIDVLAFLFVVLSIWSLLSVLSAGLNLAVYDTCSPQNAESCSLSGEACSISKPSLSFWESVRYNEELTWASDALSNTYTTLTLLPSRFKTWKPEEYTGSDSTYYRPFDSNKKTALMILDPGCHFCAKEFENIKLTEFEDRYNFTYIPYPIPKDATSYKFANSYLIASYLEAIKIIPPASPTSDIPADWQLLEIIFTEPGSEEGLTVQSDINTSFTASQTVVWMQSKLKTMGYTEEQIIAITQASQSETTREKLARNKDIVENQIHTLKIPTIMFDGRRYDRVLSPEALR